MVVRQISFLDVRLVIALGTIFRALSHEYLSNPMD
jgi:hypothetical protein